MNIFFSLRLLVVTIFIFAVCIVKVQGQQTLRLDKTTSTPQYDAQGRVIPSTPRTKGQDSLKHRDNSDDSITIHYRVFDSTTIRNIDSSINNFTARYPIPADYVI